MLVQRWHLGTLKDPVTVEPCPLMLEYTSALCTYDIPHSGATSMAFPTALHYVNMQYQSLITLECLQ